MGTAVSKRKNLRNDAISSVAAKVRAARAFGEYLSHTHPENRNGSDHLLSDTFIGQDSDSPTVGRLQNNNLHPHTCSSSLATPATNQAPPTKTQSVPSSSKRRVSLERGGSADSGLQAARVYTITGERGMLGVRGSEESLELEVLKGGRDHTQAQAPAPPNPNQQRNHHRGNHHRGNHHHGTQPQGPAPRQSQPLQSSGSAHNIRDWGSRRGGSREDCSPDCVACSRAPTHSHRSLDLETSPRDPDKQRKKLERMYSEDRVAGGERDDNVNGWFPKENMFSFQTATTTMQAISAFRGIAERKRRKREQEAAAVMERNFRKHLRMVGSRRVKVQTFAERRAKSFSRSWSDPTPIKPDSLHNSRDSGDLQTSSGTLNEAACEDVNWEEERELERAACEGDDFIPPKIMLISSKVPKAEYVPTIIRRDDPSIIPILYDHEHATFDDILEEIEKKLTAYRKGCKIWRMLIFCQGGPGHLYLLKNKVATFAKVEKEEDMIQFWKRLSRFMSMLNPEPNVIHIMGCYVLGNTNGEKLFQNLKNLMKPYAIEFKSPLELSAQGKEMIEIYFDFRLFRLWKARQHSKLLDYDDLL
ncbi:hypothetical protein AGOR_G00051840 [Albula goreensis]|uniref:NMDA receptor synaptonuclear signaling and neuronal migration factor n=1 Tax=Albula goreensis TaxID=1534307 RepID=A0A8T3DXR8_9TELE|nr:hypothetical protein AGOR_G00051840 [Albula goreensis]